MLAPLAPDLWELDAPLTVLGMSLGHRMTVARLADGSLWVHSPVAYSTELGATLAQFGPVGHVVAPNCVHDTYLEAWFTAYPEARFHGARGFARFRPDLKFTDALGDTPHPAWAGLLDQHLLRGMPRLNEVAFLHRPSRTLILTDLVFNLGPDMPLLSRVLLRLNGCYCRFAVSRLLQTTIKDRAALRGSLAHLFAWDFDRLVLSHGANLESGAKDTLRTALAFL
ncbi:MAG: DUF4336 domain-containing protein [Verrucomicrobia bacterium]|nr:DUF4336 domain-containing protein [Verrucomicrobiota bacterium]